MRKKRKGETKMFKDYEDIRTWYNSPWSQPRMSCPSIREIDAAEDRLAELEDLEECMASFLDRAKEVIGDCSEYLQEVKEDIEAEKNECYEVLNIADEYERKEMERQYWAVVL